MASMKDIKELRERTGSGVLDCKKALEAKDGDIEAAVEYLREKGIAAAAKKAGRIAAEGTVNVLISEDRKNGIVLEVNSETDFVAKTDQFQNLVNDLSQHLLQSNVNDVQTVLDEPWYLDHNKTVNTVIKETIAEIGENITLRRFTKYTTSGFLQGYIHMGGKIGVLVNLAAEVNEQHEKVVKDLAMQIAASKPEYISRDQVSAEVIDKERNIYKEQMLNEGKPEHIIDKIIAGKIEKFYSEICLLEQAFIKDADQTIKQLIQKTDIVVNAFTRFELGEGLAKKEEDFAAEVMKEVSKK
ncbi:MAG: translation elongation factor Ts [Halanaerobiales bacterium]|nr:translation elongation factor Ts [Halanaerobiales bacterium]